MEQGGKITWCLGVDSFVSTGFERSGGAIWKQDYQSKRRLEPKCSELGCALLWLKAGRAMAKKSRLNHAPGSSSNSISQWSISLMSSPKCRGHWLISTKHISAHTGDGKAPSTESLQATPTDSHSGRAAQVGCQELGCLPQQKAWQVTLGLTVFPPGQNMSLLEPALLHK